MKNKILTYTIIFITILALIPVLGFKQVNKEEPKIIYIVYLDNEELGKVKSQKSLEKFIDKQGEFYKTKFKTEKVYSPKGLVIKRQKTYKEKTDSNRTIYNKIIEKKPLTIKGYQIKFYPKEIDIEGKITEEDKLSIKQINVTKENIMHTSLEEIQEIFIGKEIYNKFKNEEQEQIEETGTIIEDIYIEETKTIKETTISIDEKIYIDSSELTEFLLFGNEKKITTYKVKIGDTIQSISFDHKINPEEFLITNQDLTSATNLLYPGQIVNIGATDPQLRIIKQEYIIEDRTNKYKTDVKYDESIAVGNDKTVQKGENGLDRVTQRTTSINGTTTKVEPLNKEVLKSSINEVLVKGDKYIPDVGNLSIWYWPTNGGYMITEDYSYRISPINGRREFHGAIDIAGTGFRSPIYAANNGTVETATYTYDYGNHIIINHNNGYRTLYSHMDSFNNINIGQIIASGEVIGFMGSTGWSTGTHLHFEVWYGGIYQRVNPWDLYR